MFVENKIRELMACGLCPFTNLFENQSDNSCDVVRKDCCKSYKKKGKRCKKCPKK